MRGKGREGWGGGGTDKEFVDISQETVNRPNATRNVQ